MPTEILTDKEQKIVRFVIDGSKWGFRDEIKKIAQLLIGAHLVGGCAWFFHKPWLYVLMYVFLMGGIFVHVGAVWELMKFLPAILRKYETAVRQPVP